MCPSARDDSSQTARCRVARGTGRGELDCSGGSYNPSPSVPLAPCSGHPRPAFGLPRSRRASPWLSPWSQWSSQPPYRDRGLQLPDLLTLAAGSLVSSPILPIKPTHQAILHLFQLMAHLERDACHTDDHDYRDFPILIAGSLAGRPSGLSPAVFEGSMGAISRSLLGCLRRTRRTSRARATAPGARSASVTAIGPAFTSRAARAASVAEAGMVKIHAQTMRRATPHRTALNRRVAPAPMTEPDTTCVVLTGNPHVVASWITAAATVWAANPSTGSIRMIRVPIVRMMRQPPAQVPRPIASAAASATHVGTANSAR